jgi:hypothetical protein
VSLNPVDEEDLYNAIVLGGVRSPGIVTLSGHDRSIGWDVKKGAGQAGATTTRTSEDPTEFVCTFYLTKDDVLGIDDFETWPAFATLINSTIAAATPKALDIYHPDLASNNIISVVLKKMGGMVHDGRGGATVAITFLEYRPPKPKGGTPKGSTAKKTKEPDPNQAALDELARLTKQYQDTPWG